MQDPSAERDPRHMRALSPRFRTRGITGTQISGGTITGKEQNAQLTGLNWVQEAEDICRAPAGALQISLGLRMIQWLRSSRAMRMSVGGSTDTRGKCRSLGKIN